ncbi:MAG TPA: hypothetical protein VFA97_05290 [Gaiellaceae bacterium]|nr:hypothetical protein [Gaiellaceae bacterium]
MYLTAFSLPLLLLVPTWHKLPAPADRFCGLARTVNGFDYVAAEGIPCAAALTETARIERGERGLWNCSRAMHGAVELACIDGARRLDLLERSPVRARRRGGIVVLANWSFRLRGGTIDGREGWGRWQSLGRAPWCIPSVPREALVALALRPVTPHGGCFTSR